MSFLKEPFAFSVILSKAKNLTSLKTGSAKNLDPSLSLRVTKRERLRVTNK